jgi:hypothetical protein
VTKLTIADGLPRRWRRAVRSPEQADEVRGIRIADTLRNNVHSRIRIEEDVAKAPAREARAHGGRGEQRAGGAAILKDAAFVKAVTLSPPCSIASLNTRESGDPADLMLTTRTPKGPSSDARFREKPSMAQQAGPNPPTFG